MPRKFKRGICLSGHFTVIRREELLYLQSFLFRARQTIVFCAGIAFLHELTLAHMFMLLSRKFMATTVYTVHTETIQRSKNSSSICDHQNRAATAIALYSGQKRPDSLHLISQVVRYFWECCLVFVMCPVINHGLHIIVPNVIFSNIFMATSISWYVACHIEVKGRFK